METKQTQLETIIRSLGTDLAFKAHRQRLTTEAEIRSLVASEAALLTAEQRETLVDEVLSRPGMPLR